MSKPIQHLNISTYAFFAVFLVLVALAVKTIIFLDLNGSPFPFLDDWRFQNDKSFITTIFTLNNENFQIFTNALYWLAPRIGIPFWAIRYISLTLVILLMTILYQELKSDLSGFRRSMLLLSFAPFFSAYMAIDLLWNNITQTWTFFILILLSVNFGFIKPQTTKNQLITFVLLLMATFSMNISLPLIFTLIYVIKTFLECRQKNKAELKRTFSGSVILTIILLMLYAHISHNDTTVYSFKTIFTADYWHWLSYSLVGMWSGFWIAKENQIFYYITGTAMSLWLVILFFRQFKNPKHQPIWAIALLFFGGIALITLFRGQMMLNITGDASRHIIYAICLIPTVYALGAGDSSKWLRFLADIWLITVLLCTLSTYNTDKLHGNFFHWQSSDACLMEHLNLNMHKEDFTCGRFWLDLHEPLSYFLKTDAAFKPYYSNNPAGAAAGFIPYHFEGKVFYKIPGKKFLLFR